MNQTLHLEITGLGLILYSPWAVATIPSGWDYLSHSFWQGSDVARHVNTGTIAAVATGTPGSFNVTFYGGALRAAAFERAEFRVRLGLEVRDDTVCVRDLYDLLSWDPQCPDDQTLSIPSGFYRISAYSSAPPSGILGDSQDVFFHLQRLSALPELVHRGVPMLC